MTKKILYLIIVITISSIAIVFYFDNRSLKQKNTSSVKILYQSENKYQYYISPTGKDMLIYDNTNDKYQYISIQKLNNNQSKVLETLSKNDKVHSFLWDKEGKRYFYAVTESGQIINTRIMTGVYNSAADSFINSEFVFSDPQGVLSGEFFIAGFNGNELFIQKDKKIFSLDVNKGIASTPVLVTEVKE